MNGATAIVPTSTSTASPQRDPRVPERPAQDRQVRLLQAARRGVRRPPGRSRAPSASRIGLPGRRNQYASTGTIVSATSSDADIAIVTVRANGRNSSPVMSPTKAIGQEHRDGRDGRRVIAVATSRTARRIDCHLVGVADVVALDVLDHDDRVVDDAADRDRERAEGEDVERVAERLDADERDQHARRDRDRRDERRAHRQQEDEDHEHGEEEAEQALLGERLDRLLDVRRLVEDDRERRRRRGSSSRSGSAASTPCDTSTVLAAGSFVTAIVSAGSPSTREIVVTGSWSCSTVGDVGDRDGARLRTARRRTGTSGSAAMLVDRRDLRAGLHGEGLVVLGDLAAGEQHAVLVEGIADRLLRVARRRRAPPGRA